MEKNKKVLIVEHCRKELSLVNESNNDGTNRYVLSGQFTTFNQKNRNNRIYEAKDFVPHVQALQEKIKNGTLLGEIEHPESAVVTLKNASHVIESLEYDEANNCIVGKIRLLSTPNGLLARALVNDGIPLHISSRAAGTVDENGNVHLQSLFTYDIVADPGFANAKLNLTESVGNSNVQMLTESYSRAVSQQINEECGFNCDDNICLYELDDKNIEPQAETAIVNGVDVTEPNINNIDNNKSNMENNINNDFITNSDFQKYTSYLSQIITNLSSALTNYKEELDSLKAIKNDENTPTATYDAAKVDNSQIENAIRASLSSEQGELEEKYNNLKKYVNYLSEQLNNAIAHQDYLAENLENSINYQEYVVNECNKQQKYTDYLAENLNNAINYQEYVVNECNKQQKYTDYLAESLDKSIAHQDYLVDECNKHQKYTDYLAENLENSINYQEYVVNECNKQQKYTDYLAESLDKSIAHQDYLVDETNRIEEGVKTSVNTLHECCNNLVNETAILSKHQDYLANSMSANNEKAFQENITESKKENFELNTNIDSICSKLDSILENAKENAKMIEIKKQEALNESLKEKEQNKKNSLIEFIPESLKQQWASLSDERKEEILNESKMYIIRTSDQAVEFWRKSDLREIRKPSQSLNVSETQKPTMDNRQAAWAKQIKNNMLYH